MGPDEEGVEGGEDRLAEGRARGGIFDDSAVNDSYEGCDEARRASCGGDVGGDAPG